MSLYAMIQERYGDADAFMREVRQTLEDEGLSQGDLARSLGCDASHISRWFSGRCDMSMETMVRVDEAVYDRKVAWADAYQDPDAFVRRLIQGMKAHGISQGQLARRSGYSPTQISRWLRGHVKPSMRSMLTLDEALELLIEGGAA